MKEGYLQTKLNQLNDKVEETNMRIEEQKKVMHMFETKLLNNIKTFNENKEILNNFLTSFTNISQNMQNNLELKLIQLVDKEIKIIKSNVKNIQKELNQNFIKKQIILYKINLIELLNRLNKK